MRISDASMRCRVMALAVRTLVRWDNGAVKKLDTDSVITWRECLVVTWRSGHIGWEMNNVNRVGTKKEVRNRVERGLTWAWRFQTECTSELPLFMYPCHSKHSVIISHDINIQSADEYTHVCVISSSKDFSFLTKIQTLSTSWVPSYSRFVRLTWQWLKKCKTECVKIQRLSFKLLHALSFWSRGFAGLFSLAALTQDGDCMWTSPGDIFAKFLASLLECTLLLDMTHGLLGTVRQRGCFDLGLVRSMQWSPNVLRWSRSFWWWGPCCHSLICIWSLTTVHFNCQWRQQGVCS